MDEEIKKNPQLRIQDFLDPISGGFEGAGPLALTQFVVFYAVLGKIGQISVGSHFGVGVRIRLGNPGSATAHEAAIFPTIWKWWKNGQGLGVNLRFTWDRQ